jgi:plasmid stabilization system protein ParE
MADLDIHPAAQAEYEEAAEWYAERSLAVAERFVAQIEAALEEIRRRPNSVALVDDQHRLYLVDGFPYYVGYRITPKFLQVVAIRHAAQDQDAWKSR